MNDSLVSAAGKFRERRFEISGTEFRIDKLLSMEAFELLETIREALGHTLAKISVPKGSPDAYYIGAILASIPPAYLRDIRRVLFDKSVRFRNGMAQNWKPLLPINEGMAFDKLTPVRVYEILVRAFAVNFTESWEEVRSLISFLGLDLLLQEQATSDQSSQPE